MLFVKHEDLLPSLEKQGLVKVEDELGLIRFEFNPDVEVCAYHIQDPTSRVLPFPDAVISQRSKDSLPETLDHLLSRIHLNEVLVIPAGVWKDVMNCVAYDMAKDEDWGEIDAIVAMHLNTRNALAVPRSETRILIELVQALFKNATEPRQDITLVSEDRSVFFEIFGDGAISLTCVSTLADEINRTLEQLA